MMPSYFCKNCEMVVRKWYEWYDIIGNDGSYLYCDITPSKNKLISFIDCTHCKKFVGISCLKVCVNCFGKNKIYYEHDLIIFFSKYLKIMSTNDSCNVCNNKNFRYQDWFFKNLIIQT